MSRYEEGKAPFQQTLHPVLALARFFVGRHVRLARSPATAGNQDDADPFGILLRRYDIQRLRQAVLMAIDDILDRGKGSGLGLGGRSHACDQCEGCGNQHIANSNADQGRTSGSWGAMPDRVV